MGGTNSPMFKRVNDPLNLTGLNGSSLVGPLGGAPVMPSIQQGTTAANVQGAQTGAANSLQSQQALLSALQGQGGLAAQNNAMNAYQNIANGTGPNPAQAMLNQQTGQNVADQSAMMAGQRGAGANVGLMARQAAQQGAATQQQAVGQGATMQANQQLNALAGQAGMANQMAGQQIGQVNNNASAQLANQQAMQNALAGINNANVGGQGNVNAANAGLAQSVMQAKSGLFGGLMNGAGGLASSFGQGGGSGAADTTGSTHYDAQAGDTGGYAEGGMISNLAEGGMPQPAQGPQSSFGQYVTNYSDNQNKPLPIEAPLKPSGGSSGGGDLGTITSIASLFAEGGLAETGGKVEAENPSQKAVVAGDSYANDKIPAKLSEGEFVLTREVMNSPDPVAAAAKMVADHLQNRKAVPKENFKDGGESVKDEPIKEELEKQPQNISLAGADPNADATSPGAGMQTSEQTLGTALPTGMQTPSQTLEAASPGSVPQAEAAPMPDATPQAAAQASQNPVNVNNPELSDIIRYNQDVATGKIHSRNLSQLFADKSTMGKIGTIFGLMLSGAGSGLAHQSNAALDMMNQQLQRDLDLQKHAGPEVRNYYNTVQDIRAKNISNATKKAEGVPAANVAGQIEDRAGGKNQGLQSYLDQTEIDQKAMAHMIPGSYAALREKYQNNPVAMKILDEMGPGVQQESVNAFAKGHDAKTASDRITQQNNQGPSSKVINEDAFNQKWDKNNDYRDPVQARQAGMIPFQDGATINNELVDTKRLEQDKASYHEAWNEINKMPLAGDSSAAKLLAGFFSNNAHANESLENVLSRPRYEQMQRLREKYGDMGAYFPSGSDFNKERKLKTLVEGDKMFDQRINGSHPVTNSYPDLLSAPKKSSRQKTSSESAAPSAHEEGKAREAGFENFIPNLKKAWGNSWEKMTK